MDGVLSNVWVFASHVKTHVEMEGITSNVNLLTHVVHLSTLNVNSWPFEELKYKTIIDDIWLLVFTQAASLHTHAPIHVV